MKKLLAAAAITILAITACNDSAEKSTTTTTTGSADTSKAISTEQMINDTTKMLDKKLADPKSTYSPDSLK